jgi:hypothetical protein
MLQLIDYLLSMPSVQKRLLELGWKPPETKGGGGPVPTK